MDKERVVGTIATIVFLIWFVGSLGGMVYFGNVHKWAMVMAILGQIFLVFGVLFIISGIKDDCNFQLVAAYFPILGGILLVLAYHYGVNGKEAVAFIEKYLPCLSGFAFLMVGISVVSVTFFKHRRKKRVCDYSIMATCVDLKQRRYIGWKTYCPVYEIYFHDQTIKLCDRVYSNANTIEVGTRKELFINPKKPKEFYEERQERADLFLGYGLGIVFIAVSVMVLAIMLWAEWKNGVHTNIELGMGELLKRNI